MAAPNIVGIATVTGITTTLSLGNTVPTTIVSNAADSNYVYKINTIIGSNDSSAGTVKLTVKLCDAAAGLGASTSLATNVGIASEATLVVLDKASSIYLEENRSISVQADTASRCDVTVSYEQIID